MRSCVTPPKNLLDELTSGRPVRRVISDAGVPPFFISVTPIVIVVAVVSLASVGGHRVRGASGRD